MYLSACSLTRFYRFVLPLVFMFAAAAHAAATPPGLTQSAHSTPALTGAGPQASGPVPGLSQSISPITGAEKSAANETGEEMTGFFVIGMIINVLMITLFLIWAVGQWQKTKK